MKALALCAASFCTILFAGALAMVAFVVVAASATGTAGAAITVSNPSEDALQDIPPVMLSLFIDEAQQCPGLPWTVMAGISKVESNHGRHGGAVLDVNGNVRPPIIGIALDGTNGTARMPDTDSGIWDGDSTWDRAVGPFQFIPSSWRLFGTDGNSDGVADPHNVFDAIGAMRLHLCPGGQVVDIEAAIFSYNRSSEYVALVLEWAATYTGQLSAGATPLAGYSLPLPLGLVTDGTLAGPHDTYPAADLAVPVGTPVFAMVAGSVATAGVAGVYPTDSNRCGTTVTINGVDGVAYTYCHLSRLKATGGQVVDAGSLIALSGGEPGVVGAGRTSGPHIHVGIRIDGVSVCPQPVLLAINRGTPINPAIAPSAGCVSSQPTSDWHAWLNRLALTPPTGGNDGRIADDG